MLRFAQHDKRGVIPSEARNPVWMLHFAYALFSMTDDVIPNAVRNPVWKCKGVQQGGDGEPHPTRPSPSKGEGRFGIAETG